ncbi:MAG: aminotransferase class V-fold PLP-dependent enzyme [Nitrososphaerota archaeon]|nr:aminotransferase class V-fold PLP-dependent enzyme [Nitrososphaerota archaeon]
MSNTSLEELRTKEFGRLDSNGHVYLDYTGGGLYPESPLKQYFQFLQNQVLGNPHSRSPASILSTDLVEDTRSETLRFFNADEDEYDLIFTQNATAALKLVGESYPFNGESRFVATSDNHNSVLGIREFAKARGAKIDHVPLNRELRVTELESFLPKNHGRNQNLFAYPAQSNFSGVQHPLNWIELAHTNGYDVILDAAAFVPTNKLDLGLVHPDFVCLSFYKMFGFPTGVGALIASKRSLGKLVRPWFSGGTIDYVSVKNQVHVLAKGSRKYEDGTLNYLGVPAVGIGLNFLKKVGMENIHSHVNALTQDLLFRLSELKHTNGNQLIRIYGPETTASRGGIIAFNVHDVDEKVIDFGVVEEATIEDNISIRAGCFCNPGAAEYAFDHPPALAKDCYDKATCDLFDIERFEECMADRPIGAIRASLGIASNARDLSRLIGSLETFRNSHVNQFSKSKLLAHAC